MLMFGGTLTCATCIELVEFLEWHCHWGLGGSWKSLCLRFYTLPLQLPVARAEPRLRQQLRVIAAILEIHQFRLSSNVDVRHAVIRTARSAPLNISKMRNNC